MCLAALSLGQHERFPMVLAANRDEYFARPAAPLAWWTSSHHETRILSGRDLEAGGTWLGLGATGRLALLTNVREGSRPVASSEMSAPSRGGIVTDWLEGTEDGRTFWQRHAPVPYNGFNLIAADESTGEWFWCSNRSPEMMPLASGLYGLSNAALDTPWPKVVTLKSRLGDAVNTTVDTNGSVDELAGLLFGALADRGRAPDERLPMTGVPKDWERLLSAAWIDASDRGYGTRCSTVVVTERLQERNEARSRTHVFELTRGETTARHIVVDGWTQR